MHGSQEVVFATCQHIVGNRYAWSYEFGDATLYEFLRKLRVFQLVANGNTITCSDKARQVSVERMMGKTGHFCMSRRCAFAIVTTRQGDAEHLSGNHGIITVGFIEVSATKQQHSVRVFRL